MKTKDSIDRRQFMRRTVIGLTVLGAGAALGACGGSEEPESLSCTTGVTPAQQQTRTAVGYADVSTDPSKLCSACQLYTPAAPGQCGECALDVGPVNPNGTCNSFAPRS